MKHEKTKDGYFLKLEKGDEVVETMKKFLKEMKIFSAQFQGFGSVEKVDIAHYTPQTKEYSNRLFYDVMSMVSLNGDVSELNGEPMVHAHICVADNRFQCFGGHLRSAIVALDCDIVLRQLDIKLKRKLDKGLGVTSIDL